LTRLKIVPPAPIAAFPLSSYDREMRNPWLDVSLEDYEGHMGAPGVAQLSALADLFEQAVDRCRPASIALLGAAGGNGLDRVDLSVTRQILALDIHPDYLNAVGERYPSLPLTLRCADLAEPIDDETPADLVHPALIFEHIGTPKCIRNAAALVRDGGFLSVVLQLPSAQEAAVSPSAYRSIQSLSEHFSLIDPPDLRKTLASLGFELDHELIRSLPSGKGLWLGIFRRARTA
jgi:hypothetical protein